MQGQQALLSEKLQQMLHSCREMQALLKSDKEFFIERDVAAIEQGNTNKNTVLTGLNQLILELKNILPEGAIKLSDYPSEINNLVNTLKEEVTECYRNLAINNNIVFNSIEQLKAVWDKLLVLTSGNNCTYDQTGTIK
jgi:D-ribose pyranose/furanose isomerase RbsD